MRVRDSETAKINNSEIKRLEKVLAKVDREEESLLKEFDKNITSILGEILIPILKELQNLKVVVDGNTVPFLDTVSCSRALSTPEGSLRIPDNFLQVVHKSYLSPELMNKFESILQEWFSNKTAIIRSSIKNVDSYEDVSRVLPQAYALASLALTAFHKRPNMILHDVQKLTGIAISEGSIAELGTGEGKTLAAVLPVYLQALRGKGAHVITANSYLARRDFEETLPIFEGLGLSSGYVPENEEELAVLEGKDPRKLSQNERVELYQKLNKLKQVSYKKDITYGSKSTFAFDYLRDNGIRKKEDMVQRVERPGFALIDEVDDALVDDAQVPYRIAMHTPTYHDGLSLMELCMMFNAPYDIVRERIEQMHLPTEGLSYQEASYIARTFLNGELMPDQREYQELAQLYFETQKILVCEDEMYGFKTGKDLFNAILDEKNYDSTGIKKKYGIIYSREKRDFTVSDDAYEGFLKFCYLSLHINTDVIEYQDKLLNDPNYVLKEDYNIVRGVVILTAKGSNKILYDSNYPKIHKHYEEYITTVSNEAAVMAHYFQQAITANLLMVKNQDYVVDGGKVKTMKNGRIQEGSTYSDGLHQAIEIRERIPRSQRTKDTVASSAITQKDFYQRYDMFSGMTGTSAKKLFYEIYGKATVEIPKHAFYSFYGRKRAKGAKEPIGVDKKPTVFTETMEEKITLIIKSIIEAKRKNPPQPVLLVVANVEEMGYLQAALKLNGIGFNTLTATTPKEKEAEIIANAGRPGMVTISTEMAGRGTDIKVGGDRETIIDLALRSHLRRIEQLYGHMEFTSAEMAMLRKKVEKALTDAPNVALWSKEEEQKSAKELESTGLKVISSGYFKMSRVDRQLEGRTGRNGISGECERYVYPDDLKRIGIGSIDGRNSVISFFKKFKKNPDGSIGVDRRGYDAITGKVKSMQEAFEDMIKENIKNTQVLDKHATELVERYREERRLILCDKKDIREEALRLIENAMDGILASYIDKEEITQHDLLTPLRDIKFDIDYEAICLEIKKCLGIKLDKEALKISGINLLELRNAVIESAKDKLEKCSDEQIKQALLMKYDYMIKNIPTLLEHSFNVKRLTAMSMGMENQADYNAEMEFSTQRQRAVINASKIATNHLIGIALPMEEDKRLDDIKYERFGFRIERESKEETEFDVVESDQVENNINIAKRIRAVKGKLEAEDEAEMKKIDKKMARLERQHIEVPLSELYKGLNVRPMKFVSAMVDGKETVDLVLVRKQIEKSNEDKKKL